MAKRTVHHAWFQYTDAEGRRVRATRGQEIDVPEGADLERGDKFGAFKEASATTDAVAVPVVAGTTDANGAPVIADELNAALEGKVDEVLAYGEAHPEAVNELIAREVGGENRKGVLSGLKKLKADQEASATTGDEDSDKTEA